MKMIKLALRRNAASTSPVESRTSLIPCKAASSLVSSTSFSYTAGASKIVRLCVPCQMLCQICHMMRHKMNHGPRMLTLWYSTSRALAGDPSESRSVRFAFSILSRVASKAFALSPGPSPPLPSFYIAAIQPLPTPLPYPSPPVHTQHRAFLSPLREFTFDALESSFDRE